MKNVFLTGASGDIGAAIKSIFEKNGYAVTAPSRQELNLEDINHIRDYFKDKSLHFDVIIHCAGFNDPKKTDTLTFEEVEKTAKINYMSFFEIVKILSPYMKETKKGHILAISSIYGISGRSGRLAYATSKHALNGAVKTFACEFGEYNILVNALSPGYVNTKMTSKNNSQETIALLVSKIPLNRLAEPEDIANTAFYLCSENNTYISGQNIIVDGGFVAGGYNQ